MISVIPVSLPTLILSLLLLFPLILFFHHSRPFHSKAPLQIKGYPIFGSLEYFTKRHDFWFESVRKSKTGNFVFRLAGLKVVGLSGEKGREAFFNGKYSFQAGYAKIFGASPALGEGLSEEDDPHFNRRIIALMKKETLGKSFEHLISDTIDRLDELGDEGLTDPFESIYAIVFQLTMRTVGCRDIAEDRVLLDRMLYLYEQVESSATATALLFPWLPSPAKLRKTYAGAQIYMIFQKIVDGRRKCGKVEDDPLQYLIDQGDNVKEIMTFLIGALFAGLLNSGINASYVLCYLSLSPHWSSLVLEEIKSVASKYSPPQSTSSTSNTLTLFEQLSQIPQDAWETEFPTIELCLKDSIRLHLQGAALRMNISGKPVELGKGEVVDVGDILAYHLADIHMDEKIYVEPLKWDPARYLPERAEDKKVQMGYLGWGIARHPCLGMRFAKLEQNIITAHFMARFEYGLTNKLGEPINKVPDLDRNAHMARKPKKGEEVYFKYSLRKE